MIETVFTLEGLGGPKLQDRGLPADFLGIWFPSALRDAFALATIGTYAPFAEVLREALKTVAASAGRAVAAEEAAAIVRGFSELEPPLDASAAFSRLRSAGVRSVTLTNGSAGATQALLRRGGLTEFVEASISTDEVQAFKAHASVYRRCAAWVGAPEDAIVLVAAHPWDIHGAKCAGLRAGYVSRGQPFPAELRRPDVEALSLADMAEAILAA